MEAVGDGPPGFVGAADKHSGNEGRINLDLEIEKVLWRFGDLIGDLIDMAANVNRMHIMLILSLILKQY